jgi:ATP-dependent RNA helicase DDX54/DBP10
MFCLYVTEYIIMEFLMCKICQLSL